MNGRLKPKSKLGHKLSVTVSSEELAVIERRMQELGCKSIADFQRRSMEHYAGEKIFRERIYDKHGLTDQRKASWNHMESDYEKKH